VTIFPLLTEKSVTGDSTALARSRPVMCAGLLGKK